MVRACRAMAIAVLTWLSLPNESCSGTRVPASFIRPICSATSRPFWISSTMSTSFSWVSWNDAIGFPNCPRSSAEGRGAAQALGSGQDRVRGHLDAGERDVALDRGAHGQLRLDRGGGEPRGGGGNEEAADAVLGASPDDADVRDRREADPSFGAVDDPAVAGPPRGPGHACRGGAS